MKVVVGLLAALMLVVPAAAEVDVYFVGDGSGTIVTKGQLEDTNFPMSLTDLGEETFFTTVVGNSVDENPFLPTYIWSETPLTFVADDVIRVHHFAGVTAETPGAGVCGLMGKLYNEGGSEIAVHTIMGGGFSYEEYVFEFTGLEGEFPVLKFQAVQSANHCGWATIEHVWGSTDYPGRMVIPAHALTGGPVTDVEPMAIVEDLVEPVVAHTFENATTALYQFNFTSSETFGLVDFAINGTGNATALLADGNGTTLFNGTVDAMQFEVHNATIGNWTLTVEYTNFTGSLDFSFLAGALMAVEDAPVADDEPAGNETVEPEEEDLNGIPLHNEEAPGFQIAAILAGLAAIVLVRRK